jgi:hypothetical protein
MVKITVYVPRRHACEEEVDDDPNDADADADADADVDVRLMMTAMVAAPH